MTKTSKNNNLNYWFCSKIQSLVELESLIVANCLSYLFSLGLVKVQGLLKDFSSESLKEIAPPVPLGFRGPCNIHKKHSWESKYFAFFSLVTNLGYLTWNLQKNDSILERIAHIFSKALNSLMTKVIEFLVRELSQITLAFFLALFDHVLPWFALFM